jgi:hypothetical protein
VSTGISGKSIALNHTCEAASLRGAGDVDAIALFEYLDGQRLAPRQSDLASGFEFTQVSEGLHVVLGEMSPERLIGPPVFGQETNLHCIITVALAGFDLDDRAWPGFDHSAWDQ